MRRRPVSSLLIACTLFPASFLPGAVAMAQSVPDSAYVDLHDISTFKGITTKSDAAFMRTASRLDTAYGRLNFEPLTLLEGEIPARFVNHKMVLRFYVFNSRDETDSVWFFPGFFYSAIQLYKASGKVFEPMPTVEPSIDDSIGYRLLTLPAHDTATFLAEMTFVKTYTNYIRPRLINKSHLSTFFLALSSPHLYVNIITYIFCGLLLMMILFSVANYILGGNQEFLYYAGYAVFLGAMLFTKTYYDYRISTGVFFMEAYLDFILQCIGIGFYMIFMQRFLSTRIKYPFLSRLYSFGIMGLVLAISLFSYAYFFTDNFIFLNGVENTTKTILLGMMIIFLVYCAKYWKDKLLRYLFWGHLFYFFFAVFSQLLILFGHLFNSLPSVFNSSLFYYELGLFLELVFFLAGLSYKNRRQIIEQTKEREQLKMENERKEFEKQMAVITAQQDERNRISTDMHDEIGSGMTHIRLMSEIAKNKMRENTPSEIEKISQSADDVLNKMNAIIWSMNSQNDSLGNLVSYIRAYALEYLEGTSISCHVKIPDDIPEKELTGDKRRNIFLCVKETLNNMLKHSKATQVTIDILADGVLVIMIADDGVGIDLQNLRKFGNGLQNIDRRMKSIGGRFEIKKSNGTETILTLPL